MEYSFVLRYRLCDTAPDLETLLESLGAAGCDDALVGAGRPGRLTLEFEREAANARAAVVGAMTEVQEALAGIRLVEIAPDFVGLSDIAQVVGMTRQNLRKLMLAHPETFPAPLHEGSAAIWHLVDVLVWLRDRGYEVPPQRMELAQVAAQVNALREQARLDALPARQRKAADLHALLR